jgi:hypothetical protein
MLGHMQKMEDAQNKMYMWHVNQSDKMRTTDTKDYGLWFWQKSAGEKTGPFYPFSWDKNDPAKVAVLKKYSFDYYLRNVKRKPEEASSPEGATPEVGAKAGEDDQSFRDFFGLE